MTSTANDALAAHLAGKHLYLTGYRGSGKSSVGRLLARQLGRRWIDSDDLIESQAGTSIRELFAASGETAFRDLEEAAIADIADRPPAVVSLGGGAILRQANRRRIAESGVCIWLCVDAPTVMRRLAHDQTTTARRPALTDLPQRQEIEKLLADRRPLYEQVAQYRVETSGQRLEQIVRRIVNQIAADPGNDGQPTDTSR
jgi:shikimate kinase